MREELREKMDSDRQPPHSHLFTMRLWLEVIGEDRTECRGEVQHVLSGEVHYFRARPALETFLLEKLEELEQQ